MNVEEQNKIVLDRIKHMTEEEEEYTRIIVNSRIHNAFACFKIIDEFYEYSGTENFGWWFHTIR